MLALAASTIYLGRGTYLGPGTWDLRPRTWDLGPGTWDLGPRTTWNLGPWLESLAGVSSWLAGISSWLAESLPGWLES